MDQQDGPTSQDGPKRWTHKMDQQDGPTRLTNKTDQQDGPTRWNKKMDKRLNFFKFLAKTQQKAGSSNCTKKGFTSRKIWVCKKVIEI